MRLPWESLALNHERVDDVPFLLGLMKQLHLPEVFQKHLGGHHLHKGLPNGHLACVWLAFLLSHGDHRKIALLPWAQKRAVTLTSLLGQQLLSAEFTDDRLGILLRRLALADWPALETELWKAFCLVFSFNVERVRLDSTTVSGYHTVHPTGLMQRGHSEDHRPDLPQLKLMGAAAQPHGHLIVSEVVSGEKADDPLYIPLIKRVRKLFHRRGLLYVGDCKMAALATRAHIAEHHDYYLTVLPMTGKTSMEYCRWIERVVREKTTVVELRQERGGKTTVLGKGSEWTRTCRYQATGAEQRWRERVQLVRSTTWAAAQEKNLEKRLQEAEKRLWHLTPPPGRGCRVWHDEKLLANAVTQVLEEQGVTGLLVVKRQCVRETRKRYVGPGRGGANRQQKTEEEVRYYVCAVRRQASAIKAAKARLGWRVYVTNAPKCQLTMQECVLGYREGWCLERDFHILKGRPLGISPLYLQRDDQILGMTRLLTIGLRILTWIELRASEELKMRQEELQGLFEGQANRKTMQPTAERLLRAIGQMEITLTRIQLGRKEKHYLTPLPPLLAKILDLFELPQSLYEDLVR